MSETKPVTSEAIDAFLADLRQVYDKHGLGVGSCGCCYSPWIVKYDENKMHGTIEHLKSEWEKSGLVNS